MPRSRRRPAAVLTAVVTGLAASLGVGLGAVLPIDSAHAFGYSITLVRAADLAAPTGVRGAATMRFATDHIQIATPAAGDVARGTYPLSYEIGAGGSVQYDWSGSVAEPSIRYDIDLDGDGRADLELLGEHRFGDDVWLNRGYRSADPTVDPARIIAAAPCRGRAAQDDHDSDCAAAAGGEYHGNLTDWAVRLGDNRLTAVGFVARTPGTDGQLGAITVGGDYRFQFTTQPRTHPLVRLEVENPPTTAGRQVNLDGSVAARRPQEFGGFPRVMIQLRPLGDQQWQTLAVFSSSRPPSYYYAFTAPSVPGRYQVRAVELRTDVFLRTAGEPIALTVDPAAA